MALSTHCPCNLSRFPPGGFFLEGLISGGRFPALPPKQRQELSDYRVEFHFGVLANSFSVACVRVVYPIDGCGEASDHGKNLDEPKHKVLELRHIKERWQQGDQETKAEEP